MNNTDYKAAYERQKKARELAEKSLEDKSRELFEANQSLVLAYNKLRDQKSQILHQEKLASIGQLAAGVAHEINNPAGFVKSNLHSLEYIFDSITDYLNDCEEFSKSEPDLFEKLLAFRNKHKLDIALEDYRDILDDSLEGLQRIEDIVISLRDFSRQDSDKDTRFDVNDCINNTLKLLRNEIKYKANVTLSLADSAYVMGQPGAMSQVILNLVSNAADAIKDNGEIQISTLHEADNIRITIQDNGSGIPQNIITKIFDPFFTTKEIGVGTGLGLSVSHNIIKMHGGRLHVDSEEGQGTCFSIFLPHAKE